MLTHRTNIFIFLVFLSVFGFLIYANHWPIGVLIVPISLFIVIEIIGTSKLSVNFHFNSICKAETNEKIVAITFDDGPHGEATEKVLTVLKEYNVTGTFFCIGKKINDQVSLLKKINEAGHIVANHSYAHGNLFDLQTTKKLTEELELTNKVIKDAISKVPAFFRPPYGVATPALGRAIQKNKMISIGWSIRSFDTSIKNPEKTFQNIQSQIKSGSIILLHDRVEGCDIVVRLLLNFLKENNYTVVNLDKLINQPAYA
ncbi:MAG TPA: polysaccharide deacetylase family protein [Bacteroidia bacterium]|jgi:peptidoglycan/xylan/chitin deacetylase (PgdA/CDA1 family)|nr:polysaccharide deacetylase family protein [Bacteroidia bacterium]